MSADADLITALKLTLERIYTYNALNGMRLTDTDTLRLIRETADGRYRADISAVIAARTALARAEGSK